MSKCKTPSWPKVKHLPYHHSTLSWLDAISTLPGTFLAYSGDLEPNLQSHNTPAINNAANNRFDIITGLPYKTVVCQNSKQQLSILDKNKWLSQTITNKNIFNILNEFCPPKRQMPEKYNHLPFTHGWVGYLSYNLNISPKVNNNNPASSKLPEAVMVCTDWALIRDHLKKTTILIQQGLDPRGIELFEKLTKLFNNKAKEPIEPSSNINTYVNPKWTSNLTFNNYKKAFDKAKHYIKNGDCYQVNLAQRFHTTFKGKPFELFKKLVKNNYAPYSAYFNWDNQAILSLSPERFLYTKNNQIITEPIKGTRPRHKNNIIDEQLKNELANSVKDQAENLMICDLMRNDLSPYCTTGSVKVTSLFDIQSYPAVHHMVSKIQGTLKAQYNNIDVLHGCFPGGSITGAPKIRAMQIINELEPHQRSAYCGSLGYITPEGNMDTNIAIRTIVTCNNNLYLWAGSGIVHDSTVEQEYQETLDKIQLIRERLQNHPK